MEIHNLSPQLLLNNINSCIRPRPTNNSITDNKNRAMKFEDIIPVC